MLNIPEILKIVFFTTIISIFTLSGSLASEGGAKKFIKSVSETALSTVSDETTSDIDKEKKLEKLLLNGVVNKLV